jgi:hypothetical protein
MATDTNTQVKGRLRNAQLRKELIRHRRIKMLTGVQDSFSDRSIAWLSSGEGPTHSCGLDELGSGAHHRDDLHDRLRHARCGG